MKTFEVTIERVQRWRHIVEADSQEDAERIGNEIPLDDVPDYDNCTVDTEQVDDEDE